jgi:hypothetical protein
MTHTHTHVPQTQPPTDLLLLLLLLRLVCVCGTTVSCRGIRRQLLVVVHILRAQTCMLERVYVCVCVCV